MVFGPKRGEEAVEWRRLYHDHLHELYSSTILFGGRIRRMRLAGHVAVMRQMRHPYRFLVGNTEGRWKLRKLWRNWKNNNKKAGFEGIRHGLGWSGWRIRIRVGLLCRRIWAFGYHKIRGISWLAEEVPIRREASSSWSCLFLALFDILRIENTTFLYFKLVRYSLTFRFVAFYGLFVDLKQCIIHCV